LVGNQSGGTEKISMSNLNELLAIQYTGNSVTMRATAIVA
jgi:hypothetical protein